MAIPTSARFQNRRIVDSVPHESQRFAGRFFGKQLLHMVHLVGRQQLRGITVDAEPLRPRLPPLHAGRP